MYTTLITTDELTEHPRKENWVIFDCRFDLSDATKGQSLYTESHIPGAIYAHLDHHLSSPITPQSGRHPMPDSSKLIEWLSSCGVSNSSQVVVYDDSFAAMSSRLWWLLKCLGHDKVAILDGGWQAWVERGLGVDHRQPTLTAARFDAELNRNCVISTAEVVDNLDTSSFQLVDVRARDRFIGKQEPIDPVAGHIPGAINIPLTDNLDEKGFFRSKQELSDLYAGLSSRWRAEQQVFMCGSGVTACHSVFAQVLADRDMPRVYAGSWSEWIRDSSRIVAKGEE